MEKRLDIHKHFTGKTLSYAFVEEFLVWLDGNQLCSLFRSLFPPTYEAELKSTTGVELLLMAFDRWQGGCECGGEGSDYQLPMAATICAVVSTGCGSLAATVFVDDKAQNILMTSRKLARSAIS
jgi:hypothetical protein